MNKRNLSMLPNHLQKLLSRKTEKEIKSFERKINESPLVKGKDYTIQEISCDDLWK